jgi:polar amino acid transport system permease protein
MFDFLLDPETAQLLALDNWGGALMRGLIATLQIALGGYALGLVIGVAGAMGKLYGGPVLRDLLGIYTTVVRAVPELVLILLLYYAGNAALNAVLAQMGYGPVELSGLVAGIYVIGIVQGAYSTEVIRGAIQSIPGGQIEAARAYGMAPFKLMYRITLPAMLPYALPRLANLWLLATKDTALLSVVGFAELTLATKQAAGATKAYFTFYTAAAAIYLAVTVLSMMAVRMIEKRARRGIPSMGA